MEVKTAILKSIKQDTKNTLVAVFSGDTKDIKASDFVITNTYSKANVAVSKVDVDKTDATKVTVTTFVDMTDGKDYTVVYDGTEFTLKATDGVVADVVLEKNTIYAATETAVNALLKDSNDVTLKTIAYGDTVTGFDFSINVTNGYTTGTKLYLTKAGDTATADLVYHSGKYDENGKETGNIEKKGVVITAIDAPVVTDSTFNLKIGKTSESYAKAANSKVAVNDSEKVAYIEIVKSDASKIYVSTDYTVESSNPDVLYLGSNEITASGIALNPVSAGTAYLIIKKTTDNSVVATLPITVVAERKATSITLDKSAATISNAQNAKDQVEITVTVKDQYGENISVEDDAALSTLKKPDGASDISGTSADGKITIKGFDSSAQKEGDYTLKIAYGNDLAKTFALKVVKPDTSATAKTSYALELSATSADAKITTDSEDVTITAQVYELKNNVKNDIVKDGGSDPAIALTYTLTKGSDDFTSDYLDEDSATGKATIKVASVSDGKKLAAGTYTLTVKATSTPASGTATTLCEYKRTITITDSQPKAVAEVKATSFTSSANLSDLFTIKYEGEEVKSADIEFVTYNEKTGTNTSLDATTYVKNVTVTITLAAGHKVTQVVPVGKTISKN